MEEPIIKFSGTPEPPRSPEWAKRQFFAFWDELDRMAKWQFPGNENLAHEAIQYVLGQVAENQWARVLEWNGESKVYTFIYTISYNLMVDFKRKKFGHFRKPICLERKGDPFLDEAYRLLVKERFPKHEVNEILKINHPDKDIVCVGTAIQYIIAHCKQQMPVNDPGLSSDKSVISISKGSEPEQELAVEKQEICLALEYYLKSDQQHAANLPERVQVILERLEQRLFLTEQEQMILRLRFIDGIGVKEIKRLLRLKGNVYRDISTIINKIKNVLRKLGLLDDLESLI